MSKYQRRGHGPGGVRRRCLEDGEGGCSENLQPSTSGNVEAALIAINWACIR